MGTLEAVLKQILLNQLQDLKVQEHIFENGFTRGLYTHKELAIVRMRITETETLVEELKTGNLSKT